MSSSPFLRFLAILALALAIVPVMAEACESGGGCEMAGVAKASECPCADVVVSESDCCPPAIISLELHQGTTSRQRSEELWTEPAVCTMEAGSTVPLVQPLLTSVTPARAPDLVTLLGTLLL